jgi:ribosomal protein S18 acetylase RimI-like enzyme
MSDELARAVAFEEAHRERAVDRVVRCRFGRAFLTDSLPLVWDLNLVTVADTGDASAGDVAGEAERVHAAAGHAHKRIVAVHEPDARRLAPGLAELGWKTDRFLFMAHRRNVQRAPSAAVEEVAREAVAPLRKAFTREAPWATSEEVVEQVLAGTARFAAAGNARYFVVRDGGVVAACADLYSDGKTAQIEDVVTLPEFRGRGYGSAVVLGALAAAREAGHDFIFLVADEDDWPKELYAKLGFEPIGRNYSFLKPPPDPGRAPSGGSQTRT